VVPQDIGRVLLNLFNNAFYAVNERSKKGESGYVPEVVVGTSNEGKQVKILVQDNGGGIPEPIREKIFQPFFTTKPTGEGTGLGLSLSYDIITKGHGGALIVESRIDQGTVFIIKLFS
jgi:signal transduction histidine kinase